MCPMSLSPKPYVYTPKLALQSSVLLKAAKDVPGLIYEGFGGLEGLGFRIV